MATVYELPRDLGEQLNHAKRGVTKRYRCRAGVADSRTRPATPVEPFGWRESGRGGTG